MTSSDKIIESLLQGDHRYHDAVAEKELAYALDIEAVNVQEELHRISKSLSLQHIKRPQRIEKQATRELFTRKHVTCLGFEKRVPDGIVDVQGALQETRVYVECGPCRVDKIVKFLQQNNTTIWHVSIEDEHLYTDEPYTIKLLIFTRGRTWQSFVRQVTKTSRNTIQKIQSPLEHLS